MKSILINFLLIELCVCSMIILNGGLIEISFDQSCNYLKKTELSPAIKCLILCEMVNCTSLELKNSSIPFPVCNISDPDPKLIQNYSITGFSINYILSNYRCLSITITF